MSLTRRGLFAATAAAGAGVPAALAASFGAIAEGWLALVDQRRYAESWAAAGAYFRGAITEAAWEQAIKAAREPLGPLVSRKLLDVAAATTLPGAPDGDYRVLRFQAHFERKAEAVETVTLQREDSGLKVVGYFIR